MSAYTESSPFADIFAEDGDDADHSGAAYDARHVVIAGHRYTRRRQDTNRIKRARERASDMPPVMPEREWVATWIELIDASLFTPPGTPRAGRILREAYADASIRLPVIRDLGRSLLRPIPATPAHERDVVHSISA